MTEDISKYGFYVVIQNWSHGYKSLCKDEYDCYEFKSESYVANLVQELTELYNSKEVRFYYKYVSWSEYDG